MIITAGSETTRTIAENSQTIAEVIAESPVIVELAERSTAMREITAISIVDG
jgi:hypothetical protein